MFALVFCCLLAFTNADVLRFASNRLCNGNIKNLRPTGERGSGVAGSQKDARIDLNELTKRKGCYQAAADRYCIQASVIAAVASRESRGGSLLYKTNGYGDNGHAYGIMQCDLRYSGLPCLKYRWDTCQHIDMMTGQLLVPYIKKIRAKFPKWTLDQTLQGGVAAYNAGVSRINSWAGVDYSTTHQDYSNDVVARAQYFYSLGWN